MAEMFGVPTHPAVIHFPIAAALLATVALFLALVRPDVEKPGWASGGYFLLLAALVSLPISFWTGRAWAISLGFLPEGALLPPPLVLEGLLRKHAQAAAGGGALLAIGFFLSHRNRRGKGPLWPVFAAALAASVLMGLTGHMGGTMVHGSSERPAAEHD